MTTAQGWVLLSILATFAGLVVTMVLAQQRSLRSYMDARFGAVDARFGSVDGRFDALQQVLDARFEGVNGRLDQLDRDMQAVVNRVFRREE